MYGFLYVFFIMWMGISSIFPFIFEKAVPLDPNIESLWNGE